VPPDLGGEQEGQRKLREGEGLAQASHLLGLQRRPAQAEPGGGSELLQLGSGEREAVALGHLGGVGVEAGRSG